MIINIKVKTGAKVNKINKIDNDNWEIKTTKRPVDNKANEAMVELIAKEMKIAKSKVQIVSGLKCRSKKVEIQSP